MYLNDLNNFIEELFWYPYVKDIKNPTPIHLEYELAGVKRDEIRVSIEDKYLKIAVESKRKTGSRIVSLAKEHDTEKAIVKYEDGLLTIDIPLKKLEKKDQRLLEIT